MDVLEWITAIVLALGMGMAGVTKLIGNATAVDMAKRLDYEKLRMPIGVAEVLAAIGVIIGAASSDLEWLGVVAAAGVVALMVGALLYHRRAGDKMESLPAAILAVVAVLYIIALFGN